VASLSEESIGPGKEATNSMEVTARRKYVEINCGHKKLLVYELQV